MNLARTKILLVDDKKDNLLALGKLLESDDIEIFTALSAEEALHLILDHDFALGLLDVQMPITTGFELAHLIRGIERSRHLPLIFVTAERGERSVIFKGYESGAVDFLQKPLDPYIVRSKVRVFVELDQQRKAVRAQLEEMALLKAAAEAANVAKSRFLANMSHEIRTPLGAVMGFSELILDSKSLDAETQAFAERIRSNGVQLLRLIDDLLDLAKVEAGKIVLSPEKVPLKELLKDTFHSLEVLADRKGIDFECTGEEGLPSQVITDPTRVRQIILNVVGNAIKFTAQGKVSVRASWQGGQGQPTSLMLDVEDTGIGISPEAQSRLFQPFVQGDDSINRSFGGSGLGIFLSRRLARALGGDLRIERSEVGVGSHFRIIVGMESVAVEEGLPLSTPDSTSTPRAQRLQDYSILLVEDVSDNQVIIRTQLEAAGAHVECAGNGAEGLEKALQNNCYDVVLMDVQMPIMDGLTATRRLRASGFSKPIVALTAHALKESVRETRAAGCDGHVSKPISFESLVEVILSTTPKASKSL